MTTAQKALKVAATVLAVFLIVCIFGTAATALFTLFGINEVTVGETKVYDVSNDVTVLEIDINNADFVIQTGEKFSIESNIKNLTVEENGGKLKAYQQGVVLNGINGIVSTDGSGAKFVLTLPENKIFGNVEIDVGAGSFTVDTLSTSRLDISFGAGDATIERLIASSEAKIDGGAGDITINDGSLTDLDLNMGVGKLNMTCALLSDCELDLGIGETSLALIGNIATYKIKADKGIGQIVVNDSALSDGSTYGSGSNKIEINSGIGDVTVIFKNVE